MQTTRITATRRGVITTAGTALGALATRGWQRVRPRRAA
jgi:hypothetical protein